MADSTSGHSRFCGLPIHDTADRRPASLRTWHSALDLEFLPILMFGHWNFFAPINGIGVRAWFLACRAEASQRRPEFRVSLCLSGRTRSEPGRQVVQTRFSTGFDRVWPGLAGFDRVKFNTVAPG
jgi:hypothetical protein